MKNTIFLFITIMVAQITFAQNNFGIQVNGGLSNFAPPYNSEEYSENFNKFSYLIGIYYEANLNDKIALGTGLNLSSTHSEETNKDVYTFQVFDIYYDKKMTSLGIPVYIVLNKNKKINFDAGLRVLFNIDRKYIYQQTLNQTLIQDYNGEFKIKKTAFGGQIGVGYQVNDRLSVVTSYYRGLSDLDTDKYESTKLKSWQLHLGLKFALIK